MITYRLSTLHRGAARPAPLARALARRGIDALAGRPLLSVLLSVLGFSFFGPLAALVLVATMLDHEFAHRALMRRMGYQPGPVRMVPLVGAFVRASTPMLRSADIALIYLAGPLVGTLSAATAALVARHTLDPLLCHQVYLGAAISIALNLFNLVPIEPLDGGLISRALPFPALLLFPLAVGIYLVHAHPMAVPLGVTLFAGALLITLRKLARWQRYTAALRARIRRGDLLALRELWASFHVPLAERMLVVGAYVLLLAGGFALLRTLIALSGWPT